MRESKEVLTTLTQAQRERAMERFSLLKPALEEGVSQTQIAKTHGLSLRTLQRWMQAYRTRGLVGLAKAERSDQGKRRGMPTTLVQLIEGLALQTQNAQRQRSTARSAPLRRNRDGHLPATVGCMISFATLIPH
jgi:putative transposase